MTSTAYDDRSIKIASWNMPLVSISQSKIEIVVSTYHHDDNNVLSTTYNDPSIKIA